MGTPVSLDLYLWEKRNQAKGEYNHHQSNQVGVGALAIISYALQVWNAKRVSEKSNVLIEVYSRSNSFMETSGARMGNPLSSFEMKFSMRY